MTPSACPVCGTKEARDVDQCGIPEHDACAVCHESPAVRSLPEGPEDGQWADPVLEQAMKAAWKESDHLYVDGPYPGCMKCGNHVSAHPAVLSVPVTEEKP